MKTRCSGHVSSNHGDGGDVDGATARGKETEARKEPCRGSQRGGCWRRHRWYVDFNAALQMCVLQSLCVEEPYELVVEIRLQLLSTRARAFVLKRPQGWRWPWHCSGEDVTTWSSTRETNHSISGLRDTVRSNTRRLKALLTQNSTSLFYSYFFLVNS